ncbi:aminotransferase class I/II-fold pyridoxal phosphate-dependent enzyme [Paenibacillus radicis (ex Xue et al. 2023)]|uniref:Aminotransferase class I/II-fold pyridoxal phosphate-dependent enzyme n=1 Tax=Paenibacillus radicis (ex Xue et al. 2023) TaxID=2972489 RepID=A0ABT1YUE9_9BACL|nr:aminotransferase class I/II-fold pyridoxal phosphate-dependent enzyme [Paenibacillus radicis (ex Xue et al. 2023)]MCR8636073.1 aminotransferase class I/II-fold pyridoxal phosphate-dependent enzyme [Paenibacillus radicis (ex Xue et al. 2023)]
MNKHKAPLFERLIEHAGGEHASFHVPGHKSGQGLEASARPYYEAMLRLDVTEIAGLDDLHHPEEAILEAQQLAADCFGAEETFFLVNGSTVGNLAMILSVCRRGELLLVQRDVHKSVIHGLMLAGARAVFLNPEVDPQTGMTLGLPAEAVELALDKYPEAKGLLITRPSYYGRAMPLEPIVQLLHDREKPLLVDEAHGAHFGFHPALPKSALSCGADVVVQSTHKLLTSMTMGAMLHVQGNLIERKEIKLYLTMLQSSSPSYPLMASLDISRKQMHTNGEELLGQGIAVVEQFKERMKELSRFELLETKPVDYGSIRQDPFKVILRDREGLMSGFELKDALEARGCFVELADPQAVLLVFSLASTQTDAGRLAEALENIGNTAIDDRAHRTEINVEQGQSTYTYSIVPGLSEPVSFDEHVYRQKGTAQLPLEESIGQMSAEMIVPYPPGIPILCPGERITEEVVKYLTQLVRMGARIHGMISGEVPMLPVLIAGRE